MKREDDRIAAEVK